MLNKRMRRALRGVAGVIAALSITMACGRTSSGEDQAASASTQPPSAPPALEAPRSTTYPRLVTGAYEEVDVGRFELVDGIAYRTAAGGRTVMFTASRTIASPVLARSACPAVHAQALALLRHASHVELTIEADGRPVTVATGTREGISSRAAGKEVRVTLRPHDATRITGALTYPRHAELTFDLPVWAPRIPQVTQAELIDGFDGPPGAAVPSEQAVRSAYDAIRTAAAHRKLAAWLRTQGFDSDQAAAIRGLPEVERDFADHVTAFLTPGAPDTVWVSAGAGAVEAEGSNEKGVRYRTGYYFLSCGQQLVLVRIAGSPTG
jgi:hypothetical protein